MAGTRWLLLCVVLLLEFDRTSPSHGQPTVTPPAGCEVRLPCQAHGNTCNVKVTTRELEEAGKGQYVFLMRDGHEKPRGQHPRYVGKVEAELRDGFLFLHLRNVARKDAIFECANSQGSRENCTVIPDDEDSAASAISDITRKALLGICVVAAAGLVALIVWIFINAMVMARENVVVENCKKWWRRVRVENNDNNQRTPPGVGGPETDMLNSVESSL